MTLVWTWWYDVRVAPLLSIWRQREFWRQRHYPLHWTGLGFCVVFWISTNAVYLATGNAPRPGWMLSAFLSVIVSLTMTWRGYLSMKEPAMRVRPAMLLLIFGIIIVLNGLLLTLMWVRGAPFETADWRIVITAGVGVFITLAASSIRRAPYASDWALFGYATSMKSLPQVWQAWDLLTTAATLNPWVVGSLAVQGSSRWQLSRLAHQDNPVPSTRWQFGNASVDLATVLLVLVVTILDVFL